MASFITRQLALVVAASLTVGCASTTKIITNPEGAKVYVNDEFYGESPVDYSDTRMSWSGNRVRLELEGYGPKIVYFRKDEKMNVLSAIGLLDKRRGGSCAGLDCKGGRSQRERRGHRRRCRDDAVCDR